MKTLMLTLLAGAVAACSHARPVAEAAPQPAPAVAAPAQVAPSATSKVTSLPVPDGSIYFDLDRAVIRPEAKEELASLGNLMAKSPSLSVRVEGNCDERGTEEYNIALGQRRADAARKYLVEMGATGSNVTTISYGKDHPRAMGHDEQSWRDNRRDDLIPNQTAVPQAPMAAHP
jgi:peptidoglycan-associated lipoprotein